MNVLTQSTASGIAGLLSVLFLLTGCMDGGKIKTAKKPAIDSNKPRLPANPRIVVSKSAKTLTLLDGPRTVKVYRCCTGTAAGDKEREGDRKTPVGNFIVCYKNPGSKFTRSLGLSYPNAEDAERGLAKGLITPEQHRDLIEGNRVTGTVADQKVCSDVYEREDGIITLRGADWEKLWKTPLGGEIMIHGAGAGRDGTAGCVGMDDADILELYEVIPVGTAVSIQP